MYKSRKFKGLIPSFRCTPKGTLIGNKYKIIPFGATCSNGFFAYFGGDRVF